MRRVHLIMWCTADFYTTWRREKFLDCFLSLWRTFWKINASWSQLMITWWWNAAWTLTYYKTFCYRRYYICFTEAYDDIKLKTNFTNFVNDVNILTYKEFIKRNCKVLNEIYDRCEQWSKMHDIKFLMTKHELIHFMKISK